MKSILILSVVLMLFAGAMIAAASDGVLDLSTSNKKTASTITLPQLTPTMPTSYTSNYLGGETAKAVQDLSTLIKRPVSSSRPNYLGSKTTKPVRDLSTLGKIFTSTVATTALKGSTPITITPSFSIRNNNATYGANDIITQSQAISANTTIYTPPIAIFGGA